MEAVSQQQEIQTHEFNKNLYSVLKTQTNKKHYGQVFFVNTICKKSDTAGLQSLWLLKNTTLTKVLMNSFKTTPDSSIHDEKIGNHFLKTNLSFR